MIDLDIDEVVREIEPLELFCDNLFGVDKTHTSQEYSFCYFISFLGHEKYYETLSNMEKLAADFLSWQNQPIPDALFLVEGEDFEIKEFSHEDDFTWISIVSQIKKASRHCFRPDAEFPLTEKEANKALLRKMKSESSKNKMEAFFEARNLENRNNDE